ncbi:hypothetical protein ACFYO2_03205 [Streptomyces sp. NPDC006602]|uniref:hypothetical protein n=1 Tax=Streptomyces sp. NPDC006602 TaxID=3364751 RepID=UPI0036BC4539
MGDIDGCARALDEAEKVHSLDGHSHNGGWLRFDGSRLPEERGPAIALRGDGAWSGRPAELGSHRQEAGRTTWQQETDSDIFECIEQTV